MVTFYLLVMATLGIGLRRLYRPGAGLGQPDETQTAARLHRAAQGVARAHPACGRHRGRRIRSPDGRRDQPAAGIVSLASGFCRRR
jgi:hypothetical protein